MRCNALKMAIYAPSCLKVTVFIGLQARGKISRRANDLEGSVPPQNNAKQSSATTELAPGNSNLTHLCSDN